MAVLLDEVVSEATEALRVLTRYGRVAAAFVFGSQAEGTAGPHSDIDLAAFVEGADDWDVRAEVDICCAVQREAGDDIDLHIFPACALGGAEPASLAEYVQKHGTRLTLGDDH
ncbi:MAG TPA: nucleotidyltransferase domain-containing protein [Planctomycetota bacterium]|nr:nucleotidyltransferase domain-containing protein [Planctomycetota bacterium]